MASMMLKFQTLSGICVQYAVHIVQYIESVGRGFESLRAHHKRPIPYGNGAFLFLIHI